MPNSGLLTSLSKFGGLLRVFGVAAFLLAAFIPATVSAEDSGSGPYRFHNVAIGGGGGFIPGIVFSTTEPGLVYTRTDIGGAYRFDQDSGLWVPLLDWIGFPDRNLSGVESIAIDPRDPHRVYLAVGTYTNEWRTKTARSFALTTRVARSEGSTYLSKSAATCPAAVWASGSPLTQTIPASCTWEPRKSLLDHATAASPT